MKHTKAALALSVALTLSVFTGCSEDDDDTTPAADEFALLSDITDVQFAAWTTSWIQPASYVQTNLSNLYIMDVRSATDFAAGHIEGAHNVAAADVVEAAASAGSSTICVVCYTGQTASWCTMALRMAGFDDAFAMKFGMASWNDEFAASWDSGASSDYVAQFSDDNAPNLPVYTAMPVLHTGQTTGEAILDARIEAVLTEGFGANAVTAAQVFGALDDYETYNYWAAADYAAFGHVPGAFQLTPGTLTTDDNLTALDPDGDNVIYCWTGQTSAFTAFYLNVLGYNALSLKFGANGMIHSALDASHAWQMGGYHANYAYTGGQQTDEFELLTAVTDAEFAGWNTTWVKTATYTHDNMADLFIVDLRSATDFAAGHIEGAHNVALADVGDYVAANNTNSDEVAVVCYTGQTAAFATMALRMLGHDAFCMKWGMAGWNDSFAGPWDAAISNDFSADMVTTASPALPTNSWPTLSTGLTSGQAILEARVDALLAEGFTANTISASTVMGAPESYNIFNYWSAADFEGVGHIDGAYQLTPGAVTTSTDLAGLHPTETNVLYCWTGQTSAFTGFYLGALGYDVVSLKFGANALMHDDLPSNGWAHTALNYPVVTN
ncbi:MAG: rhodanese-like domain-containing protein [Candidatus Delongbacteria bacterium]